MNSDEDQIRELVATWMSASRNGDVETVLNLLTEDAVFLIPGRAPMRKAEFATLSRAQTGAGTPQIDGHSEIQELQVLGDWAFMWTQLRVVVTPADGAPPIERAGHTLSILQKVQGRWRLARDANLLAPVQQPQA